VLHDYGWAEEWDWIPETQYNENEGYDINGWGKAPSIYSIIIKIKHMNNNYVIAYKTADNEFGMITVTGEDHIDAEASFYMVADENNWAIEEVMSVSAVLEFTDDVYEMEDHDNWLDQYVKIHY